MRIIQLCLLIMLLPFAAHSAEISIFAASSLTEVLGKVTVSYREKHPEDTILLHFAGSQALAAQIEQGAPADLFIAANTSAMERLYEKKRVTQPRDLLHNQLVLAIQPELKEQIASLKDLSDTNLLLVIGNPQVPIGKYTRQLFQNLAADPTYGEDWLNRVKKNVVSEENMVKAIIAKLLLGEVDAGIVYQSDLSAETTKKLHAIPLPTQHNPRATYPVAITTASRIDSKQLLDYLFSPEAQQIFAQHGFQTGVSP